MIYFAATRADSLSKGDHIRCYVCGDRVVEEVKNISDEMNSITWNHKDGCPRTTVQQINYIFNRIILVSGHPAII